MSSRAIDGCQKPTQHYSRSASMGLLELSILFVMIIPATGNAIDVAIRAKKPPLNIDVVIAVAGKASNCHPRTFNAVMPWPENIP